MKDLWPVIGVAIMVAPIAAVFLFGDHRKGCLPAGNDSVPVTYPADEWDQDEVMYP